MFGCGDYLGGVFLQCQGIALLQLRDCIGWITAVCRGNAVDLVFDAVSVSAGTLFQRLDAAGDRGGSGNQFIAGIFHLRKPRVQLSQPVFQCFGPAFQSF